MFFQLSLPTETRKRILKETWFTQRRQPPEVYVIQFTAKARDFRQAATEFTASACSRCLLYSRRLRERCRTPSLISQTASRQANNIHFIGIDTLGTPTAMTT